MQFSFYWRACALRNYRCASGAGPRRGTSAYSGSHPYSPLRNYPPCVVRVEKPGVRLFPQSQACRPAHWCDGINGLSVCFFHGSQAHRCLHRHHDRHRGITHCSRGPGFPCRKGASLAPMGSFNQCGDPGMYPSGARRILGKCLPALGRRGARFPGGLLLRCHGTRAETAGDCPARDGGHGGNHGCRNSSRAARPSSSRFFVDILSEGGCHRFHTGIRHHGLSHVPFFFRTEKDFSP